MTPEDFDHPGMPVDRVRRIERGISLVLRTGIVLSVICLVGGVAAMLIHHGDYLTDPNALAPLKTPGAALPHGPGAVLTGLREGSGRAIMIVGLLVLIATPVARVMMSIVAFLVERDWKYVVITTAVLTVLVVSVFLGKVR